MFGVDSSELCKYFEVSNLCSLLLLLLTANSCLSLFISSEILLHASSENQHKLLTFFQPSNLKPKVQRQLDVFPSNRRCELLRCCVTAQQGPPSFQCPTYIIVTRPLSQFHMFLLCYTHSCSDIIIYYSPPNSLYSNHTDHLHISILWSSSQFRAFAFAIISLGVESSSPKYSHAHFLLQVSIQKSTLCEAFHSQATSNPLN